MNNKTLKEREWELLRTFQGLKVNFQDCDIKKICEILEKDVAFF